MLNIAFVINLAIVVCEGYTLGHIRRKNDILKYYTYLQNAIALFGSVMFFITLTVCMISGREIPAFISGIRYVATCGLAATMFIFLTFLSAGKKIAITNDDFRSGCSPKIANAMLHYICPILSLVSFGLFERELPLPNGIWTSVAAIPSCLYWVIYMILSVTKLWEEPYAFTAQGGKLQEILSIVLLPLSFIVISFVLWTIR